MSININTGLIGGTIADGADSVSPFHVAVTATDGMHSGTTNFLWNVPPSYSWIKPDTLIAPEGVPMNLLVHLVNPENIPLTFSATGLPSYLYIIPIDNSTVAIQGSVYAYGSTYFWPVNIDATDGSRQVSTSFTIETEPGFNVSVPGDQTNHAGDSVYVSAGVYYNPHGHDITYTVSGLPAGVVFDPAAASITGTLDAYSDAGSPYLTVITVTDHTINYVYPISFHWIVQPAIILGSPGDQSSTVGTAVDLTIPVLRSLGLPISYTAGGLPLGLRVDSVTGHIVGTVALQSAAPEQFNVSVHADDGQETGDLSFLWNVTSAAANVVQLADTIHGGIVTLTSPVGTTLTASLGDPGYFDPNDSTTNYDFPIQAIRFQISGIAPRTAQLTIAPPAGHDWTHYLKYGPTPADPSVHWYNFLYQLATDGDSADTTGTEFLPNGQVVLHLVDGGRGDDDLTPDGVINALNGGGPALVGLSARITGLPTQTWQPGVPLTLGAQIGGAPANHATFLWQVQPYDTESGYLPVIVGGQETLTFTPDVAGQVRSYSVYLTVTSQDGQISAYSAAYFFVYNPTKGYSLPPLDHYDFSALPPDISSGDSFGGPIIAENASDYAIADFSGPIVVQITDDAGHQVANLSGSFSNGQFAVPPQVFSNTGAGPVQYTITATSGGVSESAIFLSTP